MVVVYRCGCGAVACFCRFVSLLLLWVLALFGICFGGALVLILWVLWLAGLLGLGGFVL